MSPIGGLCPCTPRVTLKRFQVFSESWSGTSAGSGPAVIKFIHEWMKHPTNVITIEIMQLRPPFMLSCPVTVSTAPKVGKINQICLSNQFRQNWVKIECSKTNYGHGELTNCWSCRPMEDCNRGSAHAQCFSKFDEGGSSLSLPFIFTSCISKVINEIRVKIYITLCLGFALEPEDRIIK